MMDADQRFFSFVQQWASEKGCKFIEQAPDSRESDHLIDGMLAADIWGWLLPDGVQEVSDEYFGCIVWEERNHHLFLKWES